MATIRDIVMYDDVGFDATHKHCLDFLNETDRDNYFSNLRDKTFFRDANYNKTENMLNLECEWETGLKFSYCSLTYNNKKMFFFVTGCKVVNEKVTGFQLVMDMWQTFLFDFKVGEAMITREHVDRWDRDGNILWKKAVSEDRISNYTNNVCQEIKTTPMGNYDGFDFYLGGLYITYLESNTSEQSPKTLFRTIFIPIITPIDTTGQNRNIKTQLFCNYYYGETHVEEYAISPTRVLYGDTFNGIGINPQSVLTISYEPITSTILENSTTISYQYHSDIGVMTITLTNTTNHIFDKYSGIKYESHPNTTYFINRYDYDTIWYRHYNPQTFFEVKSLDNTITISRPIKPSNNDNYSYTHEPELYKSPYIVRSLIDVDGSMVSEIPDVSWFENKTIRFLEINDNDNIDMIYLFINTSHNNIMTSKEFEEISNLGLMFRIKGLSLDIPSDVWKSYVLSSRDTDRQMLQSTINQQGITSSISAIVGMGGISGMAGSGRGSGLGFNFAQAGAGGGIGALMGVSGWIANQYFGWQQQEIKEQAVRNQPNNLLRTTTGDGILKNVWTRHTYNEIKCSDNAFDQASNRYHKYGYRVDMMGVPNIKTRKHFNFVQTSQIRIEGSMNQAIRDNIADIFNNGVTIWHGEYITKESGTNKFVTDYSKENIERSLI